MKVYSIGREAGCDIVINDLSNVVSRRHATLNVTSTGKMTIIDLSQNGTYVNGMRISPNVPFPVSRKDNVSFAHVARLDWKLVPNTGAKILKFSLVGLAVLAVIIGAVISFTMFRGSNSSQDVIPVVDTAAVKQQENQLKQIEEQKRDSIRKHVEDSINRAHARRGHHVSSNHGSQKPKAKDNVKKIDEKKVENNEQKTSVEQGDKLKKSSKDKKRIRG